MMVTVRVSRTAEHAAAGLALTQYQSWQNQKIDSAEGLTAYVSVPK
jgi:hypothetical protein